MYQKTRSGQRKASVHKFSCFNNQTKQAARKDREGEEETWQLFRFFPVLEVCMLEHHADLSTCVPTQHVAFFNWSFLI